MKKLNPNKLAQQIQEYVENHAKAENWEMEHENRTIVSVWYPDTGTGEHFQLDFPTPENPKETKTLLASSFKILTEEIIEYLNTPPKPIKKTVIYKVCPEMLCGDNPCSCMKWKNK